ncbi:hypothetical protein PG994_002173 [Apiospora phragmitis]|uniref:Uncharacterized protein n=1 Tax=Apiospora phragmitis TaxID=2905665 RepID=A0ABR1WVN6_9PEZI
MADDFEPLDLSNLPDSPSTDAVDALVDDYVTRQEAHEASSDAEDETIHRSPPSLQLHHDSYLPSMMVSGPPQPYLSRVIEYLATCTAERAEPPWPGGPRPRDGSSTRRTYRFLRSRSPSPNSSEGSDEGRGGSGGGNGDRSRVATRCGRARTPTNPRPEQSDESEEGDENANPDFLERIFPGPITLCMECGAEDLLFCGSVPWMTQLADDVHPVLISRGRLIIREVPDCYRCLRWLISYAAHPRSPPIPTQKRGQEGGEGHGRQDTTAELIEPRGSPGGRDSVAEEQNTEDQQAEDHDAGDLNTGSPDNGNQATDGYGTAMQSSEENVPENPVTEDLVTEDWLTQNGHITVCHMA